MVLVEDEAVLLFQATLGRIWISKKNSIEIPIASGRNSISFLGALNVKTGKEHVVTVEKQNQETMIDFLKRIRKAYPKKKILLFWDNAP